jgi:UDP-2-acetamido-3-amino-2,3-dideoxy-glucuronate N-acetyltransferase
MIHKTAEVSDSTKLGDNIKIWNQVQVRENAVIGDNVIIGKNTYVDHGVTIGKNTRIQNNVSIYHGVTIKDGVFIGPHVCFTNDMQPRSINSDGSFKSADDWVVSKTSVEYGASIGVKSVILPVNIGKWAMVGAGAVVTKDVPDYGLVYGNPAKLVGYVCKCGRRLDKNQAPGELCVDCSTE